MTRSAVNVSQGLYLDNTGHLYPITNWFDEDGDECDPEAAVAAVAGEGGCWFSLDLGEFTKSAATA